MAATIYTLLLTTAKNAAADNLPLQARLALELPISLLLCLVNEI